MGANLSHEQMEHVNAYRSSMLSMMNLVLNEHALASDNAHCLNLARGRDQVEMLSDVMLIELAKTWYATFWPLWNEHSTQQLSTRDFIQRFRLLNIPMPPGCSSEDVCTVVESLDEADQSNVIELFRQGMQHVSDAKLPTE